MRLAYRYRLYPNKAQEGKLNEWLESLRLLYNFSLAEHRDARREKHNVSIYEQKRALPELKQRFSRYADINAQVLQDTLLRLDRAFKRFSSDKGGYPRFKTKERYRSFTYPQNTSFRILEGGHKIRLSKVGGVKLRYHRPLEGIPKTATITRYPSGKWYVSICCELPDTPAKDAPLIGFDLGLKNYVTSSDGKVTEPLKVLKRAEKRLKKEQRYLSRKRKGSRNRVKQRRRVARMYERTANQRRDFLHKTSRHVVDSSSGLAFEKLRVANMLKNHHLAKAIANAGWSTFVLMVAYKAEKAGKPFVLVEPHGTTQLCSSCGSIVVKALAQRIHRCPSCGLVIDRDHNAAINVASRAGTARSHACGETASVDDGSHLQVVSAKQEAPPLQVE